MLGLAFFDDSIELMVAALSLEGKDELCKRIQMEHKDIYVGTRKLSDFVTTDTRQFFVALDIPQDFLHQYPSGWKSNYGYILGLCRVRAVKAVNDAAEHGIYYEAKISSIRQDTAQSQEPTFPSTTSRLTVLSEINDLDLRRLILSSPPKSLKLDPLPPNHIQELIDILLPFLTLLCNTPLREGVLPSFQKRSIVTPIIKQPGLYPSVPSSYRPIANVTFISNIIEKLVASQLFDHLNMSNLLPPCQSGFRKGHSTESLLLRLLSDIYGAIDRSEVTLLALFDVSAAFDSVDHDILLKRLSITFGIRDLPLIWLTSYLSERSASVTFHSSRSS